MEKVEGYKFEGEAQLEQVQFNHGNTLKLYQLVSKIETKPQDIVLAITHILYPQLMEMSKSEESKRSVCAKIVMNGETIVQCIDCRMDSSCIICLDCFKNGDHTGHKILYKKAYGGCCDCGDDEAWDPKGFCKYHSGESQDIQIEASVTNRFNQIFQDMFYLYYRLKLTRENQKKELTLFLAITSVIQQIISLSPKGIKLLAMFLQQTIPSKLKFNNSLQNQNILKHIFTWQFVTRDFKKWQYLFIKMFPYYEFKKQLLSTYIECFPILYVSEQSCMAGQSLSCQILTSYKLVEDYIDSANSEPIGYNTKNIENADHMNYISSMLCSDMQKISRLQEPVPAKYMKLVALKGIHNIFCYYTRTLKQLKRQKETVNKKNKKNEKKIKKKLEKRAMLQMKNEGGLQEEVEQKTQAQQLPKAFFNPITFMIRNLIQTSNEYVTLSAFYILLRTISQEQASLFSILRQCSQLIDNQSQDIAILRPYDRAFALTLFTICDNNLEHLLQIQLREKIMNALEKNVDQFEQWITRIQWRMLKTYFFYTHIVCNEERGYHSSFYHYIFLSRRKDNFLISTDIVLLKMIALLNKNSSALDFSELIRLKDFDEEKWNILTIDAFFHELQLIYVGKFAQIYLGFYELPDKYTSPLKNDAINYLVKFIIGQGKTTTLDRAIKFSKNFLFDNSNLLKKYLTQCCIYSKQKKVFELKPMYYNELQFNYQDFKLRLKDDKFMNKSIEQTKYELTTNLINGYNRVILQYYWNQENTESIKKILLNIHEEIKNNSIPEEGLTDLALITCKFYSNVKFIAKPFQILIADQLLLRAPISLEIKKKLVQFKEIVGSEESLPSEKQIDKKELLRLKKLKKMDEIKKKNQENMTVIREVHQIEEEMSEFQEYCAICRKKQSPKHELVYLVNLSIRNIQKLCKLGEGVQTISFSSCYHIFDSYCLQKQAKNELEGVIKCPICRAKGNILLPAYPLSDQDKSTPLVNNFIDRIIPIMMSLHDYSAIDPLSELFKSFYHYALLFQFQPEFLRKNRTKLYQTVFEIFLHKSLKARLPELINKFFQNEIALNPRLLKQEKVNIVNLKGQQLFEQQSFSDQDDQNQDFIMVPVRKRRNKKITSKVQVCKNQMPSTLQYIGLRIFKFIEQNIYQNKEALENNQQKTLLSLKNLQNLILPEVPKQISNLVNELFKLPFQMKSVQIKPLRLQFIKLPEIFSWDMAQNECLSCKAACHDLFVCLICGWKGCLNCKEGGVNKHYIAAHGEISLFLRINDGVIYIIGNKIIKKVGCLYLNEWGEQLRLKNDWNSYSIQYDILEKAKNMLLRDQ